MTTSHIIDRHRILGKMISDVAVSADSDFHFRIDDFWIQCPWAGHPLVERNISVDAIRFSEGVPEGPLCDWITSQRDLMSSIRSKIVDVLSENVDLDLGFNDPGENWFVFEDGNCLSVFYPMPIFGTSLPTLSIENVETIEERSKPMCLFDIPIVETDS